MNASDDDDDDDVKFWLCFCMDVLHCSATF